MSEEENLPQENQNFEEKLEGYLNPVGEFDKVELDVDSLAGPKRKFLDPQYLWDKCKEYFESCDAAKQSYTLPGLALSLGLNSRQALYLYLKRGDGCAKVIRAAKLKIEEQRNRQVIDTQGTTVAGRIFDLKCNFGYSEDMQNDGTDSSKQQPQMNVQQNFYGLPPQPQTLEEWTQQYQKLMKGQQQSQPAEPDTEQSIVHVSGSTKRALEEEEDSN